MSKIFISYRREDSKESVGRLHDHLKQRFDSQDIFFDVGTIKLGEDFALAIENFIATCDALLAVIGPRWLNCQKDGRRRLANPNDHVRLEIASALRTDALVIPVLVAGAMMPAPNELPSDLVALSRRNALELSYNRFDYDVERLVSALGGATGTLQIGLGSSYQFIQAAGLMGAVPSFEVRIDRKRVGKVAAPPGNLMGQPKSKKFWPPLQIQVGEGIHTLQVVARRSKFESGTYSNEIKFQIKGGQTLTFSIERQEQQFGPDKIVLKSQNPI